MQLTLSSTCFIYVFVIVNVAAKHASLHSARAKIKLFYSVKRPILCLFTEFFYLDASSESLFHSNHAGRYKCSAQRDYAN